MWIRISKSKIVNIIEAAKNKCQETEKLDPMSSECTYDIENLKCNLNSITISELELEEHNNEIEIIAEEIQNLYHIKSLHKTIEKDVRKFRNLILQEVNTSERYKKYLFEKEKESNKEIEKQIYIRKDCVHFQAINVFFQNKNFSIKEKYNFANAIFKKFLNQEKDYDINVLSVGNDDNWSECYICNQQLLCKHYMFGVHQLSETDDIDIEAITRIFAVEKEKTFYCKICGEHLLNKEAEDIAAFVRVVGAEGKRAVNREVMEVKTVEEDPFSDYMRNLVLDDMNTFKIGIYSSLKNLSGLKNKITSTDERLMIDFLESYDFVEKSQIIQALVAKKQFPQQIIPGLADLEYKRSMACDIAVRYLILLQTSSTDYKINNKFCNTNYYGYPLITD